ncbi:MAG: cytochrome c biogenesis protein ResB [Candidatus Melainabacteria bacterium]|nr:cytochrome c biogenesis protein ResB [Candidatus Melainabacteria bacterium]
MRLLKTNQVSSSICSFLSSLQFTIVLLLLLIVLAISGACIPQIGQAESALTSGPNFEQTFPLLARLGLNDVFNSWSFLICVAGLFVNLIACTISRMSEKIRRRLKPDDLLDSSQVAGLRQVVSFDIPCGTASVLEYLQSNMEALGYKVSVGGKCAVFQKGRAAWLAAPLTHLGLVILLLGVMISLLFSYSGNLNLKEGDTENISGAIEQRGPLAHVAELSVKLLSTKSDSHAGGEPKQWFSTLSVSKSGKQSFSGSLCVNSPLTFDGIDFCQSDWKMAAVALSLNNRKVSVPLADMPHGRMGVLNLSDDLILICALDGGPHLKVYLKEKTVSRPRFLAALAQGQIVPNFPVVIRYEKGLPQSGIKFKCDPGLWVTYTAFIFFFLGSIFVAVPNLKIWAAVESLGDGASTCRLGFNGVKSAHIMREHVRQIERGMKRQFNTDALERGVVTSNER